MLLLSAEKIEKSYGIKPLLEGASLYLSRGDKVGVVGLNGMGKSTLLKIIAGVEQYDSGSITKIPDRKSTRLNSSHIEESRMPSSA